MNFDTLNPRLIKQLLEDKLFSKDLIDYASSLEDTNTQDEVLQSIKVSRTGSTEEYYPIKITRQEAENIKNVLTNNNMIDKDLLKYDILEKRKVKVKKADLIGDQKWSFNFEGQSVNAKIYDKVFLEKVRNGFISINAKDTFIVDIKMELKLEEDGFYERTGQYEIINILDIEKETSLF